MYKREGEKYLMSYIEFKGQDGTFSMENPENYTGLYFPIAGEKGLKSCVTPNLGGDSKTDQNHFLLEPVSIENLHNNKSTRNFWCNIEGKGIWSATGVSAVQEADKFTEEQDSSKLEAGFMWQSVSRESMKFQMKSKITSFVSIEGNAEITLIELENTSEKEQNITFYPAVALYGRSADNIRDHRHVTSLLHRTGVKDGVITVKPVLSFDERGHQKNETTYFAGAFDSDGVCAEGYFPTVEEFIGEGGSFLNPKAVRKNLPGVKEPYSVEGKESIGAFRFSKKTLSPGEKLTYIFTMGVLEKEDDVKDVVTKYNTLESAQKELERVKKYWVEKVDIDFHTGDKVNDNYLKWICFQPVLRRIYGCSFLPYHDYGKGGRGWRDLWQDCLALLIMEPMQVRKMIVDNYCGVRFDGTNATIIGNAQGEFIADRNNITRVWMDHAFWPFITTKLYIDQTGDVEILFEKIPYFKDMQISRGTSKDIEWTTDYGNRQRTISGDIYQGSIIEHILLQNLCAFYEVGEHNEMRLRGADWNDALDMAPDKGESVAFTSAYAGNYVEIADLLMHLKEKCGYTKIEVAEEMLVLFDRDVSMYNSVVKKHAILEKYVELCRHNISGNTVIISIDEICDNLREKAEWMMNNIRNNEWICKDETKGWFNGYYDNHGNKVEGYDDNNVRMMLTSQVFSIMSGTATDEQIKSICNSADEYLYDSKAGGYRLNTNFREEKFDLGRMFGFAYGEKENGAVFSHMAVMYGNALYKRGYYKEGHKVLNALMDAAKNFSTGRMYPGIPEYFDNEGRGLYTYLTGAASWYMLTVINEVFGVKGNYGDMVICPALMPEYFDENGKAYISLNFAGKKFVVIYTASSDYDIDNIKVKKAVVNETLVEPDNKGVIRITKEMLSNMEDNRENVINIEL